MVAGVYILIRFVVIFLDILLVAMLIRALLSWFVMGDGESPLMNILYVITEPLIVPIRMLCARFGWFQGLPIDMSFFITTMILSLISLLLTGIAPV